MTAPRWLLRLLAARGLELRTAEDCACDAALRHAYGLLSEADLRASRALMRAHDAEEREAEANRKLVIISDRLRCAMAILRGEIEIPAFLPARSTETPRAPRQPEPERVAA